MKTSSLSSISYNNTFVWGYVIEMLEFLLVIVIYDMILSITINMTFNLSAEGEAMISSGDMYSSIIICFFVLLYCVPKYFKRFRTGEYAIVGDQLVVKEQFFSYEAELIIPISSITHVGFTPKFTDFKEISKYGISLLVTPFRLLEITVEGQRYVLYTYAHAKELHSELNKRIHVSQ